MGFVVTDSGLVWRWVHNKGLLAEILSFVDNIIEKPRGGTSRFSMFLVNY